MSEHREWLALFLVCIGGVIGFGVGEHDKIIEIFTDTVLDIRLPKELERRTLIIDVTRVNLYGAEKTQQFDKWPEGGIEVKHGLYRISIHSSDVEVLESYVKVIRGQTTFWSPTLEDINKGITKTPLRINLKVPKTITVGQEIPITVSTTGNGFIWIYELDESDSTVDKFPTDSPVELRFGEKFSFIDQEVAFYASKPGLSKIVVILTSSSDRAVADALLLKVLGKTTKSLEVKQNWAVASATLEVRKP